MPGVKPALRWDGNEYGEMAERFKAPVLKTGVVAIPPWVRIPLSPPRLRYFRYSGSCANQPTLWASVIRPGAGGRRGLVTAAQALSIKRIGNWNFYFFPTDVFDDGDGGAYENATRYARDIKAAS